MSDSPGTAGDAGGGDGEVVLMVRPTVSCKGETLNFEFAHLEELNHPAITPKTTGSVSVLVSVLIQIYARRRVERGVADHLLDVRDREEVAVPVLVTADVRVGAGELVGDLVELRVMEAVLPAVFVLLFDLVAVLVKVEVIVLVRLPVAVRVVLGVPLVDGVDVRVPVLVAELLLVAEDDGVPVRIPVDVAVRLRVPVPDEVTVRALVFVSAPVLVTAGKCVQWKRVRNGKAVEAERDY